MQRFIYFFFLVNILWSQQISVSDLKNLSNNELDQIKEELQSKNKQVVQSDPIENQSAIDVVQIQSKQVKVEDSEYFGYNYFVQDINFFDNIPTPSDFKLGPGDEVIISLWGETNQRNKYIIDRNGMIFFENIGFVNVSNKNIKEAETLLVDKLSKIYSTLKDKNNPTSLMLELGKIKSINVYFTGQVMKPGINLIHPFSDVFSALVQAGGVDNSGSLRNVNLIRNGEVIEVIDFYSFFTSGLSEFQKIRIIDGDVIHIPIVEKRVSVKGEIQRPKQYELIHSESILDLIDYAGGLTSSASNKAILNNIIPMDKRISDDSAKFGSIVYLPLSNDVLINNGAEVNILPIANNDFNVTIYGRVTLPGEYPIFNTTSLKQVLDLAGGFEDPIFRKSINDNIVILRRDENQFDAQEFNINYEDADKFNLKVNDKIFVYEDVNYRNSFSYTIKGEINVPGTYPLRGDLTTLDEAIKIAGGVTQMGSINSVSVTKKLVSIDLDGNEIVEEELVKNISLDFQIADGNTITILPKTNVIKVDGNVYNPGFIAHQSGRGMTLANAVELAGGYKPYSIKKDSYVIRANGEIEQVNLFRGRAKRVFPGDAIFVPVDSSPDEFDITSFIADLSSTLANIAAILVIADNN
jgi:protein involved in polysaccharide export with SLBB domain